MVFIAAGLLLPFLNPRRGLSVETRAATLLLALFVPSQIVVSLLGEGVRDLSKHLAAAQLCLDLLWVLLVLQLLAWVSAKVSVKTISAKTIASAQIGTGVRPSHS
jgi:hypothetical protein